MEPANSLIWLFGGHEKVAEITKRHVANVYRWTHPKERGGTGGMIPREPMLAMLAYARAHRIRVSPVDFLPRIEAAE